MLVVDGSTTLKVADGVQKMRGTPVTNAVDSRRLTSQGKRWLNCLTRGNAELSQEQAAGFENGQEILHHQ